MNLASVLHGFTPTMITRRQVESLGGEVESKRDCSIDLAHGILRTTWTVRLPDGRQSVRPSEMRLYMPHDIASMLSAAGFSEVRLFGGTDGSGIAMDSRRLVALAVKPPRT